MRSMGQRVVVKWKGLGRDASMDAPDEPNDGLAGVGFARKRRSNA
jgi:hypothetical protein